MNSTITFPPELPVSQRRDDIAAAIRDNQVIIVAGATGSGKTTQLPKICLELGREMIGHTQPRRIAARSVAERIAEELGGEIGGLVGYQVRFTDQVGADTRIKLMTDGILLNEIHFDRDLKKYDTIIIDEAHERSLTIDFLIGYFKRLLPRRPDLKLIITSATIDPESFSKHFDGAPIIEVSGRTYPVEIRYRPLVADDAGSDDANDVDRPGEDDDFVVDRSSADDRDAAPITPRPPSGDRDVFEGINDALDELSRESNGDVLVFLSGENEIRDAEDAIKARNLPFTEVLPLYGRLSSADQHRVFEPSRTAGTRRRIILATNVAETSLTVPGIRYVIDAGTARISRYSTRAKVQRLPIEAISQASANQRSGRSGRTSDGIAIRLYSETDFDKRPEFTEPEILRTNLAAVILQMISLGLGEIAAFPFLQPPDSRGIKDGLDLLRELRAIDGDGRITRVGRQITRLPIDPRLARMVLESKQHATTREVMAIVAGLSIQDPRERPLEKRPQADQQHARFADPSGDFLTLLNLWNYLEEKQRELGSSAFRRLCRAEFLNYLRIREWQDVYRQLVRTSKQLGLYVGERSANPDGIHKSLLAGLLSQIGLKDLQKKDYVGARQARFVVFPGSALAKKQPNAIMSAELVETSRLFARVNGAIDPAWAAPIAGDLVKRSHSEPHWEKKQGAVVAFERVTLYGVPIIPRQRVQFNRIDPVYARELFIRHALVEGDWDSHQPFQRANEELIGELTELEERTRRRDILVDGDAVFEFYHRRVPADVSSTRGFEGWWKKARAEHPDLLDMKAEDLLGDDEPEVDDDAYPTAWQQGDQQLALRYRFEPGSHDDGVTVLVPLPLLARLRAVGFDWQVPAFRDELVTALIKSLPKQIRKNVVPAADWAKKITAELPSEVPKDATEPFTETLAQVIKRLTFTPVVATDFDVSRLPGHLRMTFAVVDETNRVVGIDKDLGVLQKGLADDTRSSVARATETPTVQVQREGITKWDFDELPTVLDTRHGETTVRAYPALVDAGSSVSIQLMATAADQALATPRGVRRLLMLAVPSPVAYVQQHLTAPEKLILATSPYQNTAALFADCLVAVVDDILFRVKPDGLVFTKKEFETVRDRVSQAVMDSMFQTVSLVARTLTAARDADKALKQATNIAFLPALTDAREQRDRLIFPGFVALTGLARLQRVPVYLVGIQRRLAKLEENPARDRAWMVEVQQAIARYEAAGGTFPPSPAAGAPLVRARWMLEEFRLSLFAQDLRPAESVSLQRIAKVLAATS